MNMGIHWVFEFWLCANWGKRRMGEKEKETPPPPRPFFCAHPNSCVVKTQRIPVLSMQNACFAAYQEGCMTEHKLWMPDFVLKDSDQVIPRPIIWLLKKWIYFHHTTETAPIRPCQRIHINIVNAYLPVPLCSLNWSMEKKNCEWDRLLHRGAILKGFDLGHIS